MTNKRLTVLLYCYAIMIISVPLILSYLCVNDNTITFIMHIQLTILILCINHYAEIITQLDKDNVKLKFFKSFNISILIVMFCYYSFINVPLIKYIGAKRTDIVMVVINSFMIMLFGNYAPKIPHNKFVGYRLPWTVRDSDTWRYCHRILGYTSFPIAFLQIILVLFIDSNKFLPITLTIWIMIPGILSYLFYKRKDEVKC